MVEPGIVVEHQTVVVDHNSMVELHIMEGRHIEDLLEVEPRIREAHHMDFLLVVVHFVQVHHIVATEVLHNMVLPIHEAEAAKQRGQGLQKIPLGEEAIAQGRHSKADLGAGEVVLADH